MDVESHNFRSGHGMGRQSSMRTDFGQARTEVKPRWEGTISSWQEQKVPHHVKAVLKRLESGATVSAMSEDGVEGGLMVAHEAINSTGRTRLIKRDAVKNLVCNTPKASSVSAGGVERVRYEVEKLIRIWRSWFEGASEDLNNKVLPGAVRHSAWQMTHRHVRSDGKKQIERGCADDHAGVRYQSSPR